MNGFAIIFLGLVSFGLLHIKVSDTFHSMKIVQLFMASVSPTVFWHGNGKFHSIIPNTSCYIYFLCRLMIITGLITLMTSVLFWYVRCYFGSVLTK